MVNGIKYISSMLNYLLNKAKTNTTFTITPVTGLTLGSFVGKRNNNVVTSSFTLTNSSGSDITASEAPLASGFPAPSAYTKSFAYIAKGGTVSVIRIAMSPSGQLTLDWGGGFTNGSTISVDLTYIVG